MVTESHTMNKIQTVHFKMGEIWDFLGGPVVKTLPFKDPTYSITQKKPPKMHKTEAIL